VQNALLGRKLGKQVILVVEKLESSIKSSRSRRKWASSR
jgi:arginine decarboxylase-like protein